MSNPTDPATMSPAYRTRARRQTLATALTLSALLAALLAFSPFTPAKANPSGNCLDGWPAGVTMQLVSGDLGLPLWLGFEWGVLDGKPGFVGLCYGTGAPGDAKTAGGFALVDVAPRSDGASTSVRSESDTNSANQVNASAGATPTYSLSSGGTSGGQALTFTVPATVCSGPCQPGTQPADGQSGVIVGTISRTPTSSTGTSAAWQVDNLCVKVDGATVLGRCDGVVLHDTGVTTTGTSPVSAPPAAPGPCVVGFCAPGFDSIGTTGNQLATVYVTGLGAIPVYGVHTCLYQKDASTPCAW